MKKHHHLDVNTLRGHTDSVTALHFSSDGRNLATGELACISSFYEPLAACFVNNFIGLHGIPLPWPIGYDFCHGTAVSFLFIIYT